MCSVAEIQRWILGASIVIATSGISAEEPDDSFDFDDSVEVTAPADSTISVQISNFSVGGSLRSDWHLWTERVGDNAFAKGRQTLDAWLRYRYEWLRIQIGARGEYDFAYLYERHRYEDPTLAAYEWLVDIRDSHIEVDHGPARLKVGRLTMNWGQADMLSILDICNPRDFREPALTDIEDIRLPVLSTYFELSRGSGRIELLAVHEARFGFRSPPKGPFGLLTAIDELAPLIEDRELWWQDSPRRFSLNGQQAFARWSYTGARFDLAIVAASSLDQLGGFEVPTRLASQLAIPIVHRRYHTIGTSGAYPISSWVLRWELGSEIERAFNTRPTTQSLDFKRATLIRGTAAVGYTANHDLQLSAELTAGKFIDEPQNLLFPIDAPGLAMRVHWFAMDRDLELIVVGLINGLEAQYGWIGRTQLSYRLRPGLRGSVGYATFQPGRSLSAISGFDQHDRLLMQLRWDFFLE